MLSGNSLCSIFSLASKNNFFGSFVVPERLISMLRDEFFSAIVEDGYPNLTRF